VRTTLLVVCTLGRLETSPHPRAPANFQMTYPWVLGPFSQRTSIVQLPGSKDLPTQEAKLPASILLPAFVALQLCTVVFAYTLLKRHSGLYFVYPRAFGYVAYYRLAVSNRG